MNEKIIFFDGVCNLCNGFVDFVVVADKKNVLKIASLQGKTAKTKLDSKDVLELKSIVYFDDGKVYRQSKAVIQILKNLGLGWKILAIIFSIVPTFMANWFYDFVAQNRYRIFGKKDTCRLPTSEERMKFLE